MSNAEAITEDLNKLYAAYKKLFKSPNGKIVLADLRARFMDGQIIRKGESSEEMVARAAKHDVVQAIINITEMEK
jgi:hypothetical protein